MCPDGSDRLNGSDSISDRNVAVTSGPRDFAKTLNGYEAYPTLLVSGRDNSYTKSRGVCFAARRRR
jgi:hypothetical protein